MYSSLIQSIHKSIISQYLNLVFYKYVDSLLYLSFVVNL